jgi:hypothetical protein
VNSPYKITIDKQNVTPPYDDKLVVLSKNYVLEKNIDVENEYEYSLCSLPDNVYSTKFYNKEHILFTGEHFDDLVFVAIIMKSNTELYGCVISKDPNVEFLITHDKKLKNKKTRDNKIKCILNDTMFGYKNISYLNTKIEETKTKLDNFCKTFPLNPDILKVGVIYIKEAQTTIEEIFTNKYWESSNNYKTFLATLGIAEEFNDDFKFDDVFNFNIKVRWYPATHLDEQQIRQYVGNVQCVVIFNEAKCVDEFLLESLGKMNQIFIIVSCVNNLYHIKVIHKKMPNFPPYVPHFHLFSKDDLYTYILSKVYNGMITIKTGSSMSNLFLTPRKSALYEISDS